MLSTRHKSAFAALKYAPAIATICMLIHICLLLMGINLHIVDNIFSLTLFPLIVSIIWSKMFKFCIWHRLLLVYVFLVSMCINFQADFIGFGIHLTLIRILMLLIGVILLIIFISKSKNCDQFGN